MLVISVPALLAPVYTMGVIATPLSVSALLVSSLQKSRVHCATVPPTATTEPSSMSTTGIRVLPLATTYGLMTLQKWSASPTAVCPDNW